MTTSAPVRLNDAQMAEIAHRISVPLNDDGLRFWYRQDVAALLEEVIALRRDRASAMKVLAANPPLEGIDQTADLLDMATRLTELWRQQLEGVWQRAEVKRMRDKLADKAEALQRAEEAIAAVQRANTERSAEVSALLTQASARLTE